MKRITKLFVFLTCLSCFLFSTISANAMTITDTASDVISTSSQSVNLVNYARSYDSFLDSDYVVFSDVDNSYYIVWGDLEYENNVVSSPEEIEYIHCYRSGSGYDYTTSYDYGTSASLHITVTSLVTSNIDNLGFYSPTYNDYVLTDKLSKLIPLGIISTALIGVVMIKTLKGD